MYKRFAFLLILVAIVAALGEFVLPHLAAATLSTHLQKKSQASSMSVNLHSEPGLLVMLGQLDSLAVKGEGVQIGQVKFDEMDLQGKGVHYSPTALFFDSRLEFTAAQTMELQAVISEAGLQDLLQRKAGKVENVQVSIKPDIITAVAQANIFGSRADIDLEGKIIEQDGGLYFHMTKLSAKGARLGKISMGDLFGDVLLTKLDALPLEMQVERVEQQDGKIIIKAGRK